MNLKETIRRILKEETKLIPLILRRVEINKLNEEFNESLDVASERFFRDPEMTLDMFTHIVISMTIDGIHYDIDSTTHEDSQWYDGVFNSLKDYYEKQIKHRYNQLSNFYMSQKETIRRILRKHTNLNESVKDGEITCDNCGWNWRLSDGGKDMYICHECGFDNTPNDLLENDKEIPIRKKLLVFKYWDRNGVKVDQFIQNFSNLKFGSLRRMVVEYYGGPKSFDKHLEDQFTGKVFTCQECNYGDLTFKFKVLSATLDYDSHIDFYNGIYFTLEVVSGIYEDDMGKKYSVVNLMDDYDHDLNQIIGKLVADNAKEYLQENFTYPQYGMGASQIELY